jgi:hypothetical protein
LYQSIVIEELQSDSLISGFWFIEVDRNGTAPLEREKRAR